MSTGMVRVLLARESGAWLAQALEHDIAAHGTTLAEAQVALCRAIAAQIVVALHNGQEPLADFEPAPELYWHHFRNAQKLAEDRVIYEPSAAVDSLQPAVLASLPPAYIANDLRVFA